MCVIEVVCVSSIYVYATICYVAIIHHTKAEKIKWIKMLNTMKYAPTHHPKYSSTRHEKPEEKN